MTHTPMTSEEFQARESALLAELPLELRQAVSRIAFDRGHAYGYEEVLIDVSEMVYSLKEPVRLLCERIAKTA